MNSDKVYLRIDTPFTLKNPKTRQLVLRMVSVPVMMLLMLGWLYSNGPANRELAERMTIFCALWAVFGAVPTVLLVFNSYAMVVEGDLVCNNLGFLKKRYPRECLVRAVKTDSRIEIYSDTKKVVALPNTAAGKSLIEKLRLPM